MATKIYSQKEILSILQHIKKIAEQRAEQNPKHIGEKYFVAAASDLIVHVAITLNDGIVIPEMKEE